jgi:spore maturation protein CgeB
MKFMLVGMSSQNPSRTEYVIKECMKKNFSHLDFMAVDLEEYIVHESFLVANEFLFNQKNKFNPDIVLYSGIEGLEPNSLFNVDVNKQIIWFYDAPFHVNVCKMGNLVDHLFITAKGLVNDYKYWGVDCHWLLEGVNHPPHGVVNEVHENLKSDIVFVGTPDMRRNDLLMNVYDRFGDALMIWGANHGPPYFGLDEYSWNKKLPHAGRIINGETYPYLCSNAKIILGTNIYNNIYQYFSNRNLYTMACGGFLLTSYVPGMEELFTNHKHLVWYNNQQECLDLIEYYLEHPNEREIIAQKGHVLAFEKYSMKKQLTKMFDVCGIEV